MSTDNPQPTTESSLLYFIDHLCPAITKPPMPIEESIEPPATSQAEEQPTMPLPIVPVSRAWQPPLTWPPVDRSKQRGLRDALIALGIQAICIVFFVFHDRRDES